MATTATATTGMSARDYQHKRFRTRGSSGSGGDSDSRGTTVVDDDQPAPAAITSIDSMLPARIVTPSRSTTTASPAKSTGTSTMGGSEAVVRDGEHGLGLKNDGNGNNSPNMKQVPRHIQMEENDDHDHDKSSIIAPVMSEESDDYSEGGGSNSNSHSISNQMKRMVQTNYAQPPKSPEQFVHRGTATGTGDVTSSPLRTDQPLRYSLGSGNTNGSGNTSTSTSKENHQNGDEGHRRASDGRMGATTKAKLQAAHNLALKSTSTGEQKRVSDTQLLSSRSSSSSRPKDPNAYKIFLLLLQPKSKIFELIQLIYSPNDTTLGDILKMIPVNATEQALGTQEYLGLCRPKGEEELLDKNLLASEPTLAGAAGDDTKTAKITLGEILVAIPKGYTGPNVAALSKQILANPKIVKLLKRSDPLAPKKRRSSRSHRHSSGTGSRRQSSRRQVEILNKLDEEEEVNQEQKMKKAIANANAAAAAANDAIQGGSGSMIKIKRSDSMRSESEKSVDNMSLDESYSSWSKSFENSFSAQSSICSGVSRRTMRRKERQIRRLVVLKRTGGAALLLMVGLYFIDPRGYAEQIDEVTDNPMGLAGIFQCIFLLLTLYKLERFFRVDNGDQIRRCPFLKASANAMDQLKSRYTNKLKQNPSQNRRNSVGEESLQSSHQRMRSFSLKAGRNSDDDQDTTGSL